MSAFLNIRANKVVFVATVELRLSGLVGTSVKSPHNRESG